MFTKSMTERRLKAFYKRVSRLVKPTYKLHPLTHLATILPELNEISEILDNQLYLSGCLPLTKANLTSRGITAVLSAVTDEEERENQIQIDGGKFKRMCVRVVDTESSDLSIYFRSATAFIDNELKNGGRVLVHCVAGVSRSVSLILAYLIKYRDYTALDAYLMVRNKRTIARPNDSFCIQLVKYEKSFSARLSLQNDNAEKDNIDSTPVTVA